jgi:hypothetical protein
MLLNNATATPTTEMNGIATKRYEHFIFYNYLLSAVSEVFCATSIYSCENNSGCASILPFKE